MSSGEVQQRVLALVDLALPLSSYPSSEKIVEGIAKATLLLQVVQQAKTTLTYHVICTTKPDTNSCSNTMRELIKSRCEGSDMLQRCLQTPLCAIADLAGVPKPVHSSETLTDCNSRLKRWLGTKHHEGIVNGEFKSLLLNVQAGPEFIAKAAQTASKGLKYCGPPVQETIRTCVSQHAYSNKWTITSVLLSSPSSTHTVSDSSHFPHEKIN